MSQPTTSNFPQGFSSHLTGCSFYFLRQVLALHNPQKSLESEEERSHHSAFHFHKVVEYLYLEMKHLPEVFSGMVSLTYLIYLLPTKVTNKLNNKPFRFLNQKVFVELDNP